MASLNLRASSLACRLSTSPEDGSNPCPKTASSHLCSGSYRVRGDPSLAAIYTESSKASALRELHTLIPDFGALARKELGKWFDSEHTEHLLDGLGKAGLAVADERTWDLKRE